MKKYKVGLIIGRFQPLHEGHIYLIKEGLKIAGKIVICIGSANVSDFDNPFSVGEREVTLKQKLAEKKLGQHIAQIVQLDDDPSDEVWLKNIIKQTGPIDVVIGNNERVKRILENAEYKVQEIPFYKRHIYEGKKIREEMRRRNKL